MRLSRLRSEIERHMGRRLSRAPLILSASGVNGLGSRRRARSSRLREIGARRRGLDREVRRVAGSHRRRSPDHRVRVPGAARDGSRRRGSARPRTRGPASPRSSPGSRTSPIIDINLPGSSGLELLRRILQREPEARLIIFSMNDDPVIAARAIEVGRQGLHRQERRSLAVRRRGQDGGGRRDLSPSGDGAADRLPAGGRERHDGVEPQPRGSSRSSGSSPRGGRWRRSPTSSTSPTRRSPTTARSSSTSSAPAPRWTSCASRSTPNFSDPRSPSACQRPARYAASAESCSGVTVFIRSDMPGLLAARPGLEIGHRLREIVALLAGETGHGRIALELLEMAARADDRLDGDHRRVCVRLARRRRAGVRPRLRGEIFGERERVLLDDVLARPRSCDRPCARPSGSRGTADRDSRRSAPR